MGLLVDSFYNLEFVLSSAFSFEGNNIEHFEAVSQPIVVVVEARAYTVISQTELLNYYKQHNNIDFYTYNTAEQRAYEGKPFSLCLNDIGLNTQRFYGNDTQQIVDEFLYARNEIWEQKNKAVRRAVEVIEQEAQYIAVVIIDDKRSILLGKQYVSASTYQFCMRIVYTLL